MHEQIIYYGAPGTGKSHYVREKLKSISSSKIFRVTIHPEFTYSDFIGQFLPEVQPGTTTVTFPFKPGPFTRALVEAYSDTSKNVYLVLEELSRGNVSAIFGDIFQLLDRDKYFVSKYPIRNKNIADQVAPLITDEIKLPSNFNIIGTVNVNDQNVYPMDTAFKRRFDWKYISCRPEADEHGNRLSKLNNPKILIPIDATPVNNLDTTWHTFYIALNNFITDKEKGLAKSEDKQIGQFFLDFGDSLTRNSYSTNVQIFNESQNQINEFIKNKLLLYLWQDVQGSSSFSNSIRLFNNDIKSFDDLYLKYGQDKVFSNNFIEDFLTPILTNYPY